MIKQLNANNRGITEQIPGYSHCDGMWFQDDKHRTYRALAQKLVDTLKPQSVLELGSGAGSLAWHIRDISPTTLVVTVDGNPDTRKSPYIVAGQHFIVRTDEAFALAVNNDTVKFDLIVSFEHFEHIPAERFGELVINMVNHAAPGAILCATASNWVDDTYKHIHCNVQAKDRWDLILQSYGFTPLDVSVISEATVPFNFNPGNSHELIYRFP